MKAFFIFLISFFFLNAVTAQMDRYKKPVKKPKETPVFDTEKLPEATLVTTDTTTLASLDTIPRAMYRFYTIDRTRYIKYINTVINDSVKLGRANNKDWQDFEDAKKRLEQVLRDDPYSNVSNYVSSNKDFKSIELVDKAYQKNTARVCLRQLIFNINLSNVLLKKPQTDNTDLQLLSMAIRNIDTLCLSYIVPFVTQYKMIYPKLQFRVFDKTGAELTKANCYIVSPYICRGLGCLSCKTIVPPCDSKILDNIIAQKDYVFDCANPAPLLIAPGNYHIFIVDNGQIINYKLWSTAASDITPEPKTINLYLQ